MLQDILNLFLDMEAAEKGAANNTIDAYRRDILQFFSICKIEPKQIQHIHIARYINKLNDFAYTAKTQARKLSALREFCRFLYIEKILSENPAANFDTPKPEKALPKFLTPEQIQKLTEHARRHTDLQMRRIGVMIELMFATGLRVSEIVSLPENAINHAKKQLIVRGKGSKERIVPVAESALIALDDYDGYRHEFIGKTKSSSWLFPAKRGETGHISRSCFFKCLKLLAEECDFNFRLISPHTLRHSFATNLINHEADLRSVQKMLGHENIVTTQIYTHITSQNLLEKVRQKHPLNLLKLKGDKHG